MCMRNKNNGVAGICSYCKEPIMFWDNYTRTGPYILHDDCVVEFDIMNKDLNEDDDMSEED